MNFIGHRIVDRDGIGHSRMLAHVPSSLMLRIRRQ
jgi:hypothetical protein